MNDLRTPLGSGAFRAKETNEPPTWEPVDEKCPNCSGQLCKVKAHVEPPPMLKTGQSGEAVAVYLGCPACPFAGPALTMAAENA
jgi:hypothetical protein